VDKYTDFNIQVQELFEKRMVMPNEFAEFYNLIEKHHMETQALLKIIKYCVDMKGFTIAPQYALTVAKDWERNGIHTINQVEEKINELGLTDENMNLILSAMGSKRKIQIEDKELINKWLNTFGFELNAIIYVVKTMKNKKRRLDVYTLDEQLTKYFEMKLMAIQEIENYENEKDNLFALAVNINKQLGVFYEDLTKEIDSYIVNWLNMGFDCELLVLVADNCFKSSIRTLEGMNNILNKLFKLGIINTNSYIQYLNDNLAIDTKIKEVLSNMNLTRNVNNMDRAFYHTWITDWGFEHSVILYGATLSKDKMNAVQYLNKLLSNWNTNGTKKLEDVQKIKIETESKTDFIHNNYSQAQIASFLTNLDEVEL
jgi:DnaD/phage-associated family protein